MVLCGWRALEYLLKFADDPKAWGHENIEGMNASGLRGPLLQATLAYKEPRYEAASLKMKDKDDAVQMLLVKEFAGAKGR